MVFLVPAALASAGCMIFKVGLLVHKVRQRNHEGSINAETGYLRSYLVRAQQRSVHALKRAGE